MREYLIAFVYTATISGPQYTSRKVISRERPIATAEDVKAIEQNIARSIGPTARVGVLSFQRLEQPE